MKYQVLEDVSFKINQGEKVAIVGKSGAGKSTLAKLLVGLYSLQEGSILLDNSNIFEYSLEEVRKNVIYLPQESYFIKGSSLENIAFGIFFQNGRSYKFYSYKH